MMIRISGSTSDSSHSGSHREIVLLFASCGGIETISRSSRPSATSTNAALIRFSAGVRSTVLSSACAISSGDVHRRSRGGCGSNILAAISNGEGGAIVMPTPGQDQAAVAATRR
jgi:hypothetical protein